LTWSSIAASVVDLPEPVGTGDQDQALRLVDQFLEDARATQVFQGQHFRRNGAEHRAGAAVLVERVDAEARQPGDLEREVDLEEFLVIAALLVRHDVVDQRMHLLVVERGDVDAAHVAVDADHRRQADALFLTERAGQRSPRKFVLDRVPGKPVLACQCTDAFAAEAGAASLQHPPAAANVLSQAGGRGQYMPPAVADNDVSKTRSPTEIAALAASGQCAFGENYVQEALPKIDALRSLGLEWHLIGHLQSNKADLAARAFDWVQSVDRPKLASALARGRPADLPPLNVLLQVNIDDEASKHGCRPPDVDALADAVAAEPRLRLRGLMAIPAPHEDMARRREAFRAMRTLFDGLQARHPGIDTLSMGMSEDFVPAIEEGATMVRIGSALFGARPPKPEENNA
jgi:pyridoxal phosphate enzyme (YggS family)